MLVSFSLPLKTLDNYDLVLLLDAGRNWPTPYTSGWEPGASSCQDPPLPPQAVPWPDQDWPGALTHSPSPLVLGGQPSGSGRLSHMQKPSLSWLLAHQTSALCWAAGQVCGPPIPQLPASGLININQQVSLGRRTACRTGRLWAPSGTHRAVCITDLKFLPRFYDRQRPIHQLTLLQMPCEISHGHCGSSWVKPELAR